MKSKIIILIVILLLFIIIIYKKKEHINTSIPKKIWVFWNTLEDDAPKIIKYCYQVIRKQCPNYEFNQINPTNYNTYIDDKRVLTLLQNEKILLTQRSDLLRHYLMKKYGGIWLDSSIILFESLDWIYDLDIDDTYEMFMFKANYHTTNDTKPVLESWLIASKPEAQYNTLILNKFINVLEAPNLEDEFEKLKQDPKIDYQKFKNHQSYHIVYFIYIYILYTNNINNVYFLDCNKYIYPCSLCKGRKYLIRDLYTQQINNNQFNFVKEKKLIKLTNDGRKIINKLKIVEDSFIDKLNKLLNINYE